jgi:hypothetical protein
MNKQFGKDSRDILWNLLNGDFLSLERNPCGESRMTIKAVLDLSS